MTTFPNRSIRLRKRWTRSEIDHNIQWLLLVFLVIFSAGLSGSDDFDVFDSVDGSRAYLQMFFVIIQFYA